MRVFLAGVSSDTQIVPAILSFQEIETQEGDLAIIEWRTRGDYARANLCSEFLARKEYDAIFLTDLDMLYPKTVLNCLREHDKPIVTGHYFKRSFNNIQSVISLSDGSWPYDVLEDIPEDGLYNAVGGKPIVCTGFGNALIKREVIEAVRAMVPRGSHVFGLGPLPEMTNGDHGHFGADFRFFALAKRAGYDLWLDSRVEAEAKHAGRAWIDRNLYNIMRNHQHAKRADFYKKNYEWSRRTHG